MKKSCEECGSVNLAYDEHKGELICNDCGVLIEEGMVDFDPKLIRSKLIKKNSKERITQKTNYEKDIEKRIFSNIEKTKIFGEFADGKKLLKRFKIICETLDDLDLIKEDEIKKNCEEYYRTIIEKKLAKGKSHKIIIYCLMMCLLSDFARLSIKENDKELNDIIEDWINDFEVGHTKEFAAADRMFRKIANDYCKNKEGYSLKTPAIHLIDKSLIKLKDKKNFSLFLYSKPFEELNDEEKQVMRNLLNKSVKISVIYLNSRNKKVTKIAGLVGVCAYFILTSGKWCPDDCKNKSISEKVQREWALFLGIHIRSFKRILQNLRSCTVKETKHLPGEDSEGEIKSHKGIPLFVEKA